MNIGFFLIKFGAKLKKIKTYQKLQTKRIVFEWQKMEPELIFDDAMKNRKENNQLNFLCITNFYFPPLGQSFIASYYKQLYADIKMKIKTGINL